MSAKGEGTAPTERKCETRERKIETGRPGVVAVGWAAFQSSNEPHPRRLEKRLKAGLRSAVRRGPSLLGRLAADPEMAAGRSRRLAVVTDRYPELSETFVVNEVAELRRQGLDVLVEATTRAAQLEEDVSYIDRESLAHKALALAHLMIWHPRGVWRDLIARRRWRREETVRPLRALAPRVRRLRRRQVGHMHVHFAGNAALDAMRISGLTGVPYSVTAHAYEIFESPANLEEKLRRAAFVTTGCEYNRHHLGRLVDEHAAERIHVIIMGVDPEVFRRSTPYPGDRHVVAVGRLVEKKGFRFLLDAVARLAERDSPATLTIVGDGPLRAPLEDQARGLGLGESVAFAGARQPAAVRELLETADVLAMPAVVAPNGDRDSMPVVVKEALSMEIPVVASEEVGLPELVRPEFGRLVEPGNPGALADALQEILGLSADLRREMGTAGRRWVEHHADLAGETARLVALIQAVGR